MTYTKDPDKDTSDDMGIYKDPVTRSWTRSRSFMIGWRLCACCKVTTPPPTDADLLRCAEGSSSSCLWPWDYASTDKYVPAGWVEFDGNFICGECASRARKALGITA